MLTATNPLLTAFSVEARSYSLLALLALLMMATFLHAFAFGRRRMLPAFVASTTVLLYTHNWGLYLVVGAALRCGYRSQCCGPIVAASSSTPHWRSAQWASSSSPGCRPSSTGPRHTGAPWSPIPDVGDLIDAAGVVMARSPPPGWSAWSR